ncbi:major vault protein, partial [Clonorchis sinensis]
MISLSPMQYCVIRDPVIKSDEGIPVFDEDGVAKLRAGDEEYRFFQDPFPLYPGEHLHGSVQSLPVVSVHCALRLQAIMDFSEDNIQRAAGEEWLFEGPGVYYPRKEVKILKTETAQKIEPNTALCLRALKDCFDRSGLPRVYGEQWLVKKPGAYLPGPYEEVVEKRMAYKLTDKTAQKIEPNTALCLRALKDCFDRSGLPRVYGEQWLVKKPGAYLPGPYEEVVEKRMAYKLTDK